MKRGFKMFIGCGEGLYSFQVKKKKGMVCLQNIFINKYIRILCDFNV